MTAPQPANHGVAGSPAGEQGPRHVAIIMDGNGRWAKRQGKNRSLGHEAGVEALRRTVEAAGDLGLDCLTVYAFSTENWSRPALEVNFLMTLLKLYVKRDVARLNKAGVRVRMIGRRDDLPADILKLIVDAEKTTETNSELNLNIAFNYGGRQEILNTIQEIAARVVDGSLPLESVNEEEVSRHVYTAGQPDPDLIIRTSGESRLSNFLLWQAAYAELLFLDVLWPDFERRHLEAAIADFRSRDRRFGGVTNGSE